MWRSRLDTVLAAKEIEIARKQIDYFVAYVGSWSIRSSGMHELCSEGTVNVTLTPSGLTAELNARTL